MKKGGKIFWLTCGITLVVGIALLGIGLGMGATMEIVKERAPIKKRLIVRIFRKAIRASENWILT